jgi:hypothetical protein
MYSGNVRQWGTRGGLGCPFGHPSPIGIRLLGNQNIKGMSAKLMYFMYSGAGMFHTSLAFPVLDYTV